MIYEFEDNIPAPEPRAKASNKGMTSFIRSMFVGQSFLMPNDDPARAGVYQIAKNIGYKVVTKKEDDFYVRVWRIE